MKIVFLDAATMGDVSFAPIEQLGELVCYDRSTPEEALERVGDCEVMIINKVKVIPELIDAAPKLRLICEAATGVNNIDLAYAAQKGIPVRNAVGYSTDSVVQATFMHILSLVGNAPYFDKVVKSAESVDIDAFIVSVEKKDGKFAKTWVYAELPSLVELSSGEYTITVTSPETEAVAWEQPSYAATKDIAIVNGAVTPVDMVCTLQNMKNSVYCSQHFMAYVRYATVSTLPLCRCFREKHSSP